MLLKYLTYRFEEASSKVPIRLVLVMPFVIQIFVAVGLTGWLSFRNGQKAVNSVAAELRREMTATIEYHLNDYLTNPHLVNQINANAFGLGQLNPQDLSSLERHFTEQFRIFNSVSNISFASQQGEYIGVRRLETGELQLGVAEPSTGSDLYIYSLNPRGDRANLLKIRPDFDPRRRQWYRQTTLSGRSVWSDIYTIWDNPQLLLISANQPVYGQNGQQVGVMSASLFLSQIGDFLSKQNVDLSRQTFIIDRSGELVASSISQPLTTEREGKIQRVNALESSDLTIRSTVQHLVESFGNLIEIDSQSQLSFSIKGKRQFLQVTPLRKLEAKSIASELPERKNLSGKIETSEFPDWLIVVVVPEAEFMERINANRRSTILLCIAALGLATLLGIATSQWISRPILSLSHAAAALSELEWEQSVPFVETLPGTSLPNELGVLATAFNRMARRLQESFSILKQREAKTRAIASRLAEAQKVAHVGSWEWDLTTATLTWSDELFRIFGLDPNSPAPTYQEFLQKVVPEDVSAVQKAIARAIERGTPYELDFQIIQPNGQIRQVYAKGRPTRDAEGRSQRLFSTVMDITARKQAELALQESQRTLATVMSNLPGMAYRCQNNRHWTIEFVSEGCFDLTGYYPVDFINNHQISFSELMHPDDRDPIWQQIQAAVSENRPYQLLYRLSTASGEQKWVWEKGRGVVDTTGKVRALEGMVIDISDRKRAEEALREAEFKYRHIFENAIEGIFQTTPDGRYISANPALSRILGYNSTAELVTELTNVERQLYVDPDSWKQFVRLLQTDNVVLGLESQVYRKDGTEIWISQNGRAVRDADGSLLYCEGTVEDITEHRQVKRLLAGQNQVLEIIAKGTPLCEVLDALVRFVEDQCARLKCSVLLMDKNGIHLRLGAAPNLPDKYNRAVDGISIGSAMGSCGTAAYRGESVIVADIAVDPLWEKFRDLALECGLRACWSIPVRSGQGKVLGTFAMYYGEPRTPRKFDLQLIEKATQLAGIAIERALAEERLQREALYDPLTNLPNRTWLMRKLEKEIAQSRAGSADREFAVLFLDIDGFKVINDSLGHLVGDRLLERIARRLEACAGKDSAVARLGGDEFTILLENINDVREATASAQKIHKQLAAPFRLNGHEVFVNASIGIVSSRSLGDRASPEELLRDADIAMYRAKELGRGRYAIFDAAMHERAVARLHLETELRRALSRREFQLYYQPIVSVSTGRLTGFEALVRWCHPVRGIVSPTEFIPVAEETGLIIPLGGWVLEEACRQMGVWQQKMAAARSVTISVNLSGVQLMQAGLLEQIDRVLQRTGLQGRNLKLELTESMVMEISAATLSVLEELRHWHVQLCIDDFGTGYSSLSRLHDLPIDTLKIDQSFVRRIEDDCSMWKMLGTIVMLADNLGMEAIAEGVETAEQLAHLRSFNCQYAQGYFFSKPLNAMNAEKLIAASPQW